MEHTDRQTDTHTHTDPLLELLVRAKKIFYKPESKV